MNLSCKSIHELNKPRDDHHQINQLDNRFTPPILPPLDWPKELCQAQAKHRAGVDVHDTRRGKRQKKSANTQILNIKLADALDVSHWSRDCTLPVHLHCTWSKDWVKYMVWTGSRGVFIYTHWGTRVDGFATLEFRGDCGYYWAIRSRRPYFMLDDNVAAVSTCQQINEAESILKEQGYESMARRKNSCNSTDRSNAFGTVSVETKVTQSEERMDRMLKAVAKGLKRK
ncbi:MAG: hypothetical protein ACKPKO_01090, partial [Candidatus Fonsibacter sp.]